MVVDLGFTLLKPQISYSDAVEAAYSSIFQGFFGAVYRAPVNRENPIGKLGGFHEVIYFSANSG
jgi:hypothetical protein